MNDVYKIAGHPASFGGVNSIYHSLDKKISRNEIKDFLENNETYTLHRSAFKKFPRNKVIVYHKDEQWQADLVDLNSLKKYNGGSRYILTCIDVFSKYAWIKPLHRKTGEALTRAFRDIFKERKPKMLQTDAGKEFQNKTFQTFLKTEGVRYFTTYNATKASVAERFNRSLKTKMWKYFTEHNTYRYLDVLEDFASSYNHTYHSSIKRAPVDVTLENSRDVWLTLYGGVAPPAGNCKFKAGDFVRVSKAKLTFEKGYEHNWTEEIFEITECVSYRHPKVYRIRDLLKEDILGTFYSQELQKVKMKEEFPIEKILKKRFRKNRFEYWVKYRGYSEKFNQWLTASQLTGL